MRPLGLRQVFTIVVDKISHAYAEQGAVKARVKTCHALSLDDPANGIVGRRLGALGFHLRAGGERDEWVSLRSIGITLPVKLKKG